MQIQVGDIVKLKYSKEYVVVDKIDPKFIAYDLPSGGYFCSNLEDVEFFARPKFKVTR